VRDIIAGDEGKPREVGVKNEKFDATAGDESLTEERTFSGDGSKHFGFASSMVPTLEEKIIAEGSEGFPSGSTTEKPVDDEQESQRTPEKEPNQARSGDLYGAPADASQDVTTDDQPPHAVSGVDDADEKQEKAAGARAHIRKHLDASFGSKPWTLPTPTPHVDPHGFSDPISDAFWRNTWVACAVHNVRAILDFVVGLVD
jgi:phospholipase D1/2